MSGDEKQHSVQSDDFGEPEKYDDAFAFAVSVYDETLKTFENLEAKAGRYLTALAVVFGASMILTLAAIKSAGTASPYALYSLISVLFIYMLASTATISLVLWSLRVSTLQYLRFDDDMLSFFEEFRRIDTKYALSKSVGAAIHANDIINTKKARYLATAHSFMFFAMFPSFFLLVMLVVSKNLL